ncbi:MAG TPA: hypothetical protein VHR65_03690 [Solirubrobacterales bacterium]|jgi:hypothetical protein|nr:hypothetical protein [Solirubrobacterales bacterium]
MEQKEKEKPKAGDARPGVNGKKALRIGFWVVLAIAAVVILRSVLDNGGSSDKASMGAPEIVSVEELRDDDAAQGSPIYWAGVQEGTELELSRPEEGRTYVRYLPEGTAVGDESNQFLSVGTYVYPEAAKALRELGKQPGGIIAASPNGGVVYFNRNQPENVYLAFPGSDLQIEVYDPNPKRSLGLVASGQVVPIG